MRENKSYASVACSRIILVSLYIVTHTAVHAYATLFYPQFIHTEFCICWRLFHFPLSCQNEQKLARCFPPEYPLLLWKHIAWASLHQALACKPRSCSVSFLSLLGMWGVVWITCTVVVFIQKNCYQPQTLNHPNHSKNEESALYFSEFDVTK